MKALRREFIDTLFAYCDIEAFAESGKSYWQAVREKASLVVDDKQKLHLCVRLDVFLNTLDYTEALNFQYASYIFRRI